MLESLDDDTKFLMLASMSLWSMMSNQQVVDAIKKIKNPKKAVEHLIQLTLNNNMKKFLISDDITCIVVRFG